MSFMSDKYKKPINGTTLYRANTLAVASLSANLSKDDFYLIIEVIESAYTAGVSAGREQHAAELRALLGIPAPAQESE